MHTSTNEWDDREVEIAYDGIITRDSVIEFLSTSHRSLNNGDDIGLDISGEGTSNEYQEIAVYLRSEHFEVKLVIKELIFGTEAI